MSLVIGRPEDVHTAAVVEAVRGRGADVLVFDAAELGRTDLFVDPSSFVTYAQHRRRRVGGERAWLRRLAPEDWYGEVAVSSHDAVVRSSWIALLAALCNGAGCEWLTDLPTLHASEDKLLQLRVATRLGIEVPKTVLVTHPDRIPPDLGEQVVVKPFGVAHFRDGVGSARVVHATAISRDDPALELLAGAPFLVQELVDAVEHRRVVTVRDQVWVCTLDAEGIPMDWRTEERAHSSFQPTEDASTASQALLLARDLGIGYSSQDWILDRTGRLVFLDLNPAGQWLFLPPEVSIAVTEAIASWLTK